MVFGSLLAPHLGFEFGWCSDGVILGLVLLELFFGLNGFLSPLFGWLNYMVFWRRIEYFIGVGDSASFFLSNTPLLFHLATLPSDVKARLELLLAVSY